MKKKNSNVTVIHLGNREKSGIQIVNKLQVNGYTVFEVDVRSETGCKGVVIKNIAPVIVNIGNVSFDYGNLILDLIENNNHIVINEALISNNLTGLERINWERGILNKLEGSKHLYPISDSRSKKKDKIKIDETLYGIEEIWILAASIGGPEAISKFLSVFKGNEKYLFIVVQHIEQVMLTSLAEKLKKVCKIKVYEAISGMPVNVPSCIVHPINDFMNFDENMRIDLTPLNQKYKFTPCIDEVAQNLSNIFEHVNIAIFSGMSTDGVNAAKNIYNNGGKVIVQNESSCVVASIIQGIKKNLEPDFEGNPKEMAQYILNHI